MFEEGLFISEIFAPYISADEEPYEPVMDIFHPIINDIRRVRVAGSNDYDAQNNTLVGVLAATVYWRNILKNTLPQGSSRIAIVFNNTCTKAFTYQINGPSVVFVGVNDKHDAQYDYLRVSSKITALVASVYSGAPLLVIFGLGLVFLLYDFKVERRQRKVLFAMMC